MQFQDDLAAGVTLVRPALQSPDYETGVSGWAVKIDGSAEFSDIVIRGGTTIGGEALYYNGPPAFGNMVLSIAATAGVDAFGNSYPAGLAVYSASGTVVAYDTGVVWENVSGSKIEIDAGGAQALQQLTPPDVPTVTWADGSFGTNLTADFGANTPSLFVQSPSHQTNTAKALIELLGGSPTLNDSKIRMSSNLVQVLGDFEVTGVGQVQYARRTADLSRNTNVITDDTEITFTVEANAVYAMTGWLKFSALENIDLQVDFSTPAGALGEWTGHGQGLSTTVQTTNGYLIRTESNDISQSRNFSGTTGTVGTYSVLVMGTLRTAGTAGTYALQWGQGALDAANPTTVYADSWLRLERVA